MNQRIALADNQCDHRNFAVTENRNINKNVIELKYVA